MYSSKAERGNWEDEAGREVKERDAELIKELAAPLYDLPKVEYAFAYGSGVFAQPDLQPDFTEEVRLNIKTQNPCGCMSFYQRLSHGFCFKTGLLTYVSRRMQVRMGNLLLIIH